tara:strand:+ start:395 stop:571 length:177 start_codon:yes stop_codon:yes gene_type:complete
MLAVVAVQVMVVEREELEVQVVEELLQCQLAQTELLTQVVVLVHLVIVIRLVQLEVLE